MLLSPVLSFDTSHCHHTSNTDNMAPSRRIHKMGLRKAPIDANDAADSSTPKLPTVTLPVVAPQANPQTESPLFALPAELRNRIYDHVFRPRDIALVNGKPVPIDLDTVKLSQSLMRYFEHVALPNRRLEVSLTEALRSRNSGKTTALYSI